MTVPARTSRRGLVTALMFAALLAAGCGGGVGREQQAQQDALGYEQQVGQINTAAAMPSASPAQTRDRLAAAVKAYDALRPPAILRPVHRRTLRALRHELRSVRDGLRATAAGDAAGIRAAETQGARARAAVTRALAQMTARVARCRASLPACVPASASAGDG